MTPPPQHPPDSRYEHLWKSIVNVMKNSNLKISRIAKAGSRARRQHRPDSDMDIIFAVVGDPPREKFYPDLMRILQSNFPEADVSLGTEGNVVKLVDPRTGARFDLVLLTEADFDDQHSNDVEYRRKHLQ